MIYEEPFAASIFCEDTLRHAHEALARFVDSPELVEVLHRTPIEAETYDPYKRWHPLRPPATWVWFVSPVAFDRGEG